MFNIALNIALIPVIGLKGSALATTLALTLQAIMTELAARHLLVVPRPRPSTWLFAIGGTVFALAAIALPTSGMWMEARALVSLLCATLVVMMMRRMPLTKAKPIDIVDVPAEELIREEISSI